MNTYRLYLASLTGRKLSGYTNIVAVSLVEAIVRYRSTLDLKKIDLRYCEILCER